MKKRYLTLTMMILGGVPGLFAQTAPPSGPLPCTQQSLATYDANNGALDCTIGDLEFHGFSFSGSGSGAVAALDGSIQVIPDLVGLGGGFTFSGWQAADVGPGQSATYSISYDFVLFGDPPAMDGASLGMDPPTGVTISDLLCPSGNDCFAPLGVDTSNPPHDGCGGLPNLHGTCWIDSEQLPDITNGGSSSNTITLTGTANSGAGFDDFDNIYDVVQTDSPEPVTGLLGFGGLVAIGLVRRYR